MEVGFDEYLLQFTDVPRESLDKLLDLFDFKSLKKNELYIKEGRQSKKLAFVKEGFMRAYYRNYEGEEFNIAFFTGPSIVADYTSLITGNSNKINIEALTDCILLQADFPNILALYDDHPKIERLNRIIAEDFFVKKEEREISLAMHDAAERYALFRKEHPVFESNIAQYHIASYLGITPTQLSRIRAQKS